MVCYSGGESNLAPFFVSAKTDIIPKEERMRTKARVSLVDRVTTFLTHVFNGFGIIGLTYVVCNDITAQEIISWLTK